MASRYKFTEEQIQELTKAAKANKDKNVDRRLRALLMRAKGKKLAEIASATGYSFGYTVKLVAKYREEGLSAIVENHYEGNHRIWATKRNQHCWNRSGRKPRPDESLRYPK